MKKSFLALGISGMALALFGGLSGCKTSSPPSVKRPTYVYIQEWNTSKLSPSQRLLGNLGDPHSTDTESIRYHRMWDRADKLLWQQSFTRDLQIAGMENEEGSYHN